MLMRNNKLCLTSVVEFLRRGRVDRGTGGGKVVVVVDLSKRKVKTHIIPIDFGGGVVWAGRQGKAAAHRCLEGTSDGAFRSRGGIWRQWSLGNSTSM